MKIGPKIGTLTAAKNILRCPIDKASFPARIRAHSKPKEDEHGPETSTPPLGSTRAYRSWSAIDAGVTSILQLTLTSDHAGSAEKMFTTLSLRIYYDGNRLTNIIVKKVPVSSA